MPRHYGTANAQRDGLLNIEMICEADQIREDQSSGVSNIDGGFCSFGGDATSSLMIFFLPFCLTNRLTPHKRGRFGK